MLNQFIEHIKSTQLFNNEADVLLAVSGGKDSMVMLDLFMKANYKIGVAHCNFKLRDKESDLDEQLVNKISSLKNVDCYTTQFNTQEYAKEKGLSIQMAARELRYNWFKQIALQYNYKYIATAHHKNDVVETVLINLTKGTGLAGLHGIYEKKENIIRPLLSFSRKEIDDYAKENSIDFRDDESNSDTKYIRNRIRHNVLPELEKINPAFINSIIATTKYIKSAENVLQSAIDKEWKNCSIDNGEVITINIEEIQKLEEQKTYLFYFLNKYGFNESDVKDIISGLNKESGIIFKSNTHTIVKNRSELILTLIKKNDTQEFIIQNIEELALLPFNIEAEVIKKENVNITKKSNCAFLDLDKIKFPITVRKWQNGDKFIPFGMKGAKKISDFFIDNKLSLIEKEAIWLMISDDNIFWVVNQRIDNRYRIEEKTENILFLQKKLT